MFSWAEHDVSFITSGPGNEQFYEVIQLYFQQILIQIIVSCEHHAMGKISRRQTDDIFLIFF